MPFAAEHKKRRATRRGAREAAIIEQGQQAANVPGSSIWSTGKLKPAQDVRNIDLAQRRVMSHLYHAFQRPMQQQQRGAHMDFPIRTW